MMKKKDSQNGLKLKLSAILKSPFSRRGKKKLLTDEEDGPRTSSSYEVDLSMAGVPAGGAAFLRTTVETDATSTIRGSRSFDANASQLGPVLTTGGRELGSTDGRVCTLLFNSVLASHS